MLSQKINKIYEKAFVSYPETRFNRFKRQFITDVEYEKFRTEKQKYKTTSAEMFHLKKYFEELEKTSGFNPIGMQFTPKELFDISHAYSVYRFANVTVRLMEENIIKREVRVNHESGVTLYNSYLDVPDGIDEKSIETFYIIIKN